MINIKDLPMSTYFTLEHITEWAYVAISKNGQGAWANAGIIDLGEELLIIDTFLTPNAAKDLRNTAEKLTGKKVKFVVNTHSHFSHTLGNQIFADVTIIGTKQTKEVLKSGLNFENHEEASRKVINHLDFLINNLKSESDSVISDSILWEIREYQKLLEAIRNVKLTLPDKLMDSKYTIKGSKRVVELYAFGGSDVLVYLPNEKVMFTGELVLVQNHPRLGLHSTDERMKILNQIQQFEIKQIIPSHGPVGQNKDIMEMVDYIEQIKKLVQQKEITIPEKYKTWGMLHNYLENIEGFK